MHIDNYLSILTAVEGFDFTENTIFCLYDHWDQPIPQRLSSIKVVLRFSVYLGPRQLDCGHEEERCHTTCED